MQAPRAQADLAVNSGSPRLARDPGQSTVSESQFSFENQGTLATLAEHEMKPCPSLAPRRPAVKETGLTAPWSLPKVSGHDALFGLTPSDILQKQPPGIHLLQVGPITSPTTPVGLQGGSPFRTQSQDRLFPVRLKKPPPL